jgi:hypothetical protein
MYALAHGGEEQRGSGNINIIMRDNRMSREVAGAVFLALKQLEEQYLDNVKIA